MVSLTKSVFVCVVLSLLMSFIGTAQSIIINEVMASNSGFYPDEDGSFEDWIELYNAGEEAVNLEGYGLSDDYDNPFRWTFPEYILQPGEHLWVWASGKDRKETPGQWHRGIKRRHYPDITGTAVEHLLNHSSFPDHPSERNVIINYFEAPTDIADYYGQHMFTWLVAPQSGYYIFRISSDDNSRLYLSMDASTENVVAIADVPGWTQPREWSKYAQQTSEPVFLEEGQIYYLEAFMKEHAGGDNLSVMWEWPDGTIEEPISAYHCFIPETRFHTNFSIRASGEEIILTNPQGERIDNMPATTIPQNVSYGRLPGNYEDWFYFDIPTPGMANNTQAFTGLSSSPVITPAGGVYRQALEVSIHADDPEAEIYYTTDGTKPSPDNGILYQHPVMVNNTLCIRAVAIGADNLPSEISAQTYSVANQQVRDFSSNLPVMIIHSFDKPITPGFRTAAYMTLIDNDENGRTVLTGPAAFSGRIKINIRGSSSQMFPKKGFGFHTLEEDDSNRKVSLLGMPEEHNWILHGPYSDKSLMRNAFSYALGEDAGHYSPRTRFIELFMHGGSGQLSKLDYHGVYVLTERIKIAPGRLDLMEMDVYHNDYPEITGGYIFKIDRLNPGDFGFYTQRESHFVYTRPDEQTISLQQEQYLVSYLDSLETSLFGENFSDPAQGYAAYMDVQSFIDMHLITELTKEIDGFRLSTFFYKDRDSKIFAGPLWDFNLALGNANYLQGWIPQGWYHELISENDYNWGWYNRLFEDPAFSEYYNRRYRFLRLTAFSDLNLMGSILENQRLLLESQARNFERWNVLGTYVWPNWFIASTWQEEVAWMKNWLQQRLVWMDNQLGEPYTMIHYWNFNDEDYLLPSYSVSDGSLFIDGGVQSEVTTGAGQGFSGQNARNGDKAGQHLRINDPIGTELFFKLSSKNYQDLTFSYEARRSGNGANRHYISYSYNGETFIAIDTLRITDQPGIFSMYFGEIPEVNDNEDFSIRITIAYDPDDEGGMSGNNRLDNVTLDGEAMSGVKRPPLQILPFDDHIAIRAGDNDLLMDMNDYFRHPDGIELFFSVNNPNPEKASIEIENNNLVISPMERGGLHFSLEVYDAVNPPLKKTIYLLVYPEAHVLKAGDYVFDFWSPNEPDGSFPAHMLFVQGTQDDAPPGTPMVHAYSIPESDYASSDQHNIGFPYRNQSRTRINGLGMDGVSFINTGRGRDLGAAVLAIDTRETESPYLSWQASTIRVNSRVYHMRLQYRTCITKTWKNWVDADGHTVEYQRSTHTGHSELFENLLLPEDAMNQEYVQIRWLYYFTGLRLDPNSGARDMLGLNRIKVVGGVTNPVNNKPPATSLKVYPNPSVNGVFSLNKSTSGQIVDLHGRHLLSVINADQLLLGHLPAGVYFFRSKEGEVLKLFIGL